MNIAEIFTSIQGEGTYSGYPTVFIRLAGCNLRCLYCDTQNAQSEGGKEMDSLVIAQEVFRSGVTHVCITGGEPLLQTNVLFSLLSILHDSGYIISIETNGTIDFRPLQPFSSICMDVKCPSSGEKSDLSLLSFIREMDSVKYVIGSFEDLTYAHETMNAYPVEGVTFWSPVFGYDNQEIITYIMEKKLPVRFQLQLHKIVGVK
jgi:7-carboxy-7-deazaguanine synthase